MKLVRPLTCLVTVLTALALQARADNARFDLVGPKVDVRVTRGDKTLPIAQVPNLQPGDRLWVKADLPDTQRNHLLLIVAFLRGTTNEPPDSWFTEIDTWDRKHTSEGTTVFVPDGAEQALLFIAPETGGDFKTLRSAVKGKPGLFIRADSDLNEASFEQQRIVRYLAAMKNVPTNDPKAIQDHSAKLASTLALKPNADCFKQPVEAQVNCLTQSSAPVLLSDGHGQTVAEALSTGPSSDFINAASYTSAAGGGLYSAYVGAVVDLVHLVSTLHTAKYQYIPGLSFPQEDTLQLRLNAPVSFVDPKSVIVIGLPAIQKAVPPPLHSHDPEQVACLLDPKLALQLEGAPLVFSTSFAHDLVLHLNVAAGPHDIPLTPDAFEGGLVVTTPDARQPLSAAEPPPSSPQNAAKETASTPDEAKGLTVTGTVRGYWGFDPFDGPTLTLQQKPGKDWKVVSGGQLLAGEENQLVLQGEGTACVQHISLTTGHEKSVRVSFKTTKDKDAAGETALDLDVPLKSVQPGGYALAIQQYGGGSAEKVPLTAYTGDIHLEVMKLHQGDNQAVLEGSGLNNVAEVRIGDDVYTPAAGGTDDSLSLVTAKPPSKTPSSGTVKLKDGRTMNVKVELGPARPRLMLASMEATPSTASGTLPVTLEGKAEIPLSSSLHFVVSTQAPFPRGETVEVATADESLRTTLSLDKNSLILQDTHTAIASLDPQKAFGDSAFGPLQMRPIAADGTAGDWTALGTLVRTPQINAISCTGTSPSSCEVSGSNLFLVQAFSADKNFTQPVDVPSGFAQGSLSVPAPSDGTTLYLKLRDDPSAIASIALPQSTSSVASAPGKPQP